MSDGPREMIDTIIANTYTIDDVERRIGVLRGCVESALFTETELSYLEECTLYLSNQASEDDAKVLKEWGAPVLNAFSQNNVGTLIQELHDKVATLPVLTIYLPCMFPESELKLLAAWCRETGAPRTVFNVHIDPSVVGGCAFVAGDTYREISFDSRLKESPQLITNILSEYARE